jgi:hypothetical protein
VRHIARVGSTLFWMDGGSGLVYRYPLPSGPAEAINPSAPTNGYGPLFAVDANGVYFSSMGAGTLYRADLTGGGVTPVVTGLANVAVDAIGIDSARLYFSVFDSSRSGFDQVGVFSVAR